MRHRRPRLTRGEEGLTLIELLATISIMGIAFIVVVGGLLTSVLGSDVHRRQANSEAVLRSFAEAVKAEPYVPCATAAVYGGTFTPLTGYTTKLEKPAGHESENPVGYWSSAADDFTDGPCLTDEGLQRLSLKVTAPNGRGEETVDVVKRDPAP